MKLALTATAVIAAGLTACNSNHSTLHLSNAQFKQPAATNIQSGMTSEAPDIPTKKVVHSRSVRTTEPSTSGASSPDTINQQIYEQPTISYSRTPNPGGIAPQDRNLRYGLVGNGTGIGTEDTTSKYLTDNGTAADPLVKNQPTSTGALSSATDDQDALKDIKSGTTFQYYDIEN